MQDELAGVIIFIMTEQQKYYAEISTDIETLGTKSDAHIAAIGAVKFNLEDEDTYESIMSDKNRLFYDIITLNEFNGEVNPGTLAWWMSQDDDVRSIFFAATSEPYSLKNSLERLNDFVKHDSINMWGNGATFDNVILRSGYDRVNLRPAWSFRKDFDLRTIIYLATRINPTFSVLHLREIGSHHNALTDAVVQALMAQQAWKIIEGKIKWPLQNNMI